MDKTAAVKSRISVLCSDSGTRGSKNYGCRDGVDLNVLTVKIFCIGII